MASTTVILLADKVFSGVSYKTGQLVSIDSNMATQMVATKQADTNSTAIANAVALGNLVHTPSVDASQINTISNTIKNILNPNVNNKIIYIGDSFVGRSLGANGLSGSAPCLSGFPFWVQFLTSGKMNLFGILGFSGYTTIPNPSNNPGLTAMVAQYAKYLKQADYIFAEGGINDVAIATTLAQRIANLETYWTALLALGPQIIVPTINPNWQTGPTETIQQQSQLIAMNDYIIKQGKKARFLVADIYKRLTVADGSLTGNLRAHAPAVVTGPPHLAVLGTYYYARAIADDVINQIPGLLPAPRGVQETLNPYVINNNPGMAGNIASGTAYADVTLGAQVTGTAPYHWQCATYSGATQLPTTAVTASCNVTNIDDQIASGIVPILGDVDFNQWNFSFTTTTAGTGLTITQLFGSADPTGGQFANANTYPAYSQGYLFVFQNGITYKALVPYGTYQQSGASAATLMAAASTLIGEVTSDGVVAWQALPPIKEGTVLQVSVRIQLLTNPLNVPMQLYLSLTADNATNTHQAQLYQVNCGQEVLNGYIASCMTPGLDYPNDYLPFGTGEEFLIQSLPIVLRDPVGGGANLQTLLPQLTVLSSAVSASAITFAIRDFEVRVIGYKPASGDPITYY